MSKRIALCLALTIALSAACFWVLINHRGSESQEAFSQARADEFVIAKGRMSDPVEPAALEIYTAEADIKPVIPDFIDRRNGIENLNLFEKPSPKTPKLMGMGYPVQPQTETEEIGSEVPALQQEAEDVEAPLSRMGPMPGLRSSFDTTDFDDNVTTTGSVFIPPDSHAAAGPNHIVNVVNTTIRFHSKTGTLQFEDSLANFFAALSPLTNTFDPKVLYDQYARRFVVVTLEQTDTFVGAPANTSRIFLAVSDNSDPNGTWFTTAINAATVIGGTPSWADYPGFAVDRDAVYIAANMFGFFGFGGAFTGNLFWAISKDIGTGFYAGGPVTGTVFNPVPPGGFGTTLQPSHMYGFTPFTGTFVTGFSGLSNGVDEFFQVIRIEDPLATPLLDLQFINFGNADDLAAALPGAPQLGSPVLINTNDRRTLDAVWRDDQLYVTTTVDPAAGLPDAGEATAVWAQLDTSNLAAVALADLGFIGGEDIAPNTFTTFPSIAVNRNGDVAVGFSAAAASIYASSYFATRLCTDPAGMLGPSTLLRAGTDFYVRTFGNANRWGDYSSAAVDPLTNMFWIYNQHAIARGTPTSPPLEDGRWGTAVGLTAPCVQTTPIQQNIWTMISLPCESRGATVANSFGDDLAGTYGVDWFVYRWNATTQSYTLLSLSSRLGFGVGYFLRTRLSGQSVTVGDVSNNKFGYKLQANPVGLTWNLKGHPYPITSCWADALVIDGPNLLTLDQADPLIGGVRACDMVPPDPSCVMSRTALTWNGASFDAIDGITPGMQGTLTPWEGIFIRAFKSGIGIRFNSVDSVGCGGPSAGTFETRMQDRTTAMQEGWYARIVLSSLDLHDSGAIFGQLPDSKDGRDSHDLIERKPFPDRYLMAMLTPGFGLGQPSIFNSDYRALDGLNSNDVWRFQVIGTNVGRKVTLQIDAPDWLIENAVLVDETESKRMPAKTIYSYRETGQARKFAFYPK